MEATRTDLLHKGLPDRTVTAMVLGCRLMKWYVKSFNTTRKTMQTSLGSLASRLGIKPSTDRAGAASPLWKISIVFLICSGVFLRLKQYLCNRSLWLDEACLALNIVHRPYSVLVKPLDHGQQAPIGFLMIEKLSVSLFGNNEYALRLFPFLCGVMSLFLFCKVAGHYIEKKAMLAAVGLFSFLPALIYYSSETKQYSGDVMFALLLFIVAIPIQQGRSDRSRISRLGVVGAAAIWFSHPSVFVLAGIGTASLVDCLVRKDGMKLLRLSAVYFMWLLSFAICWHVSLGGICRDKNLSAYWNDHFMPFPPRFFWLMRAILHLFSDTASLRSGGLAALVFLTGCVSFFLKNKLKWFSLILPLCFAFGAAAFHAYPFSGRLMLFAVPTVLILMAEGLDHIRSKTSVSGPLVSLILTGFLFFYPLENAFRIARSFVGREEIKPVMNYIKEHRSRADLLYVYYGAAPAFRYYAEKYGLEKAVCLIGVASRQKRSDYIRDLNSLRGRERVWVLFSHIWTQGGMDEERFFINHLNTIGSRLDVFRSDGAALYLYDCGRAATSGEALPMV